MKLNKKIAVPILSTAMGLSLIGGVGGAVAWYQYNSRVTASFVGSSVADSTVLQIGKKVNNEIVWGRNVDFGVDNKLTPVTFGKLINNDDVTDGLPNQAYGYPEAGARSYADWTKVAANKGYVQFTIYLRAFDIISANDEDGVLDGRKLAARDIFISELQLNEVTSGKDVSEALRMHISVKNQKKNFLISEQKVEDLKLYGNLDLDGINGYDKEYEDLYVWEQTGSNDPIMYGVENDKQSTLGIDDGNSGSDIVVERDANGYMPKSGDADYSKKICTTSDTLATEVTITVWLEGWAALGEDDDANGKNPAVWNSLDTADSTLQVGLKFDCGRKRTSFN